MSFNERIRALRGGMTQSDFANQAGINVNTLRNYERGDSIPNLEVAASICRHFHVSSDWLLLGEGSVYRSSSERHASDCIPASAFTTPEDQLPSEPPPEDFKMSDMLTKTAEILESDTIYRTALASNINAFHQAVRSERTLASLEERIVVLERKMDEVLEENRKLKQQIGVTGHAKAVGEGG